MYTSDVVQQAIQCIAAEMSKLDPVHVVRNGNDYIPKNDQIQRVLKNPNNLMTSADFIEKIIWQLYLTYNSFIIPIYENGKLQSLYPLQPEEVSFIEEASGELYVKLRFENNFETMLPYNQIIHLRLKYSVNDFMGGNQSGNPDLDVLMQTIEINNQLLDGIATSVRGSLAVNAVVKYHTKLDKGKMEKALEELTERLNNSESGFLPMDIEGEFIPIKKDIAIVDDKTLAFLDQKILRHFGVSIPILTGDYSTDQYAAFYQKTLEPLIIKLSQAFTKVLFTEKEIGHGNEINFYPEELIFLSTDQRIQMMQIFAPSGTMFENEKRRAFGMRPLEELAGKRMQSLNYIDTNIAAEYQLQKGKDNE